MKKQGPSVTTEEKKIEATHRANQDIPREGARRGVWLSIEQEKICRGSRYLEKARC